MPAPEIIHQLVQQFQENQAEYKYARYNEAQLRHEFLPHEKERLEREIASTDAQIDHLVYKLYGLTEDEIRIVEGS